MTAGSLNKMAAYSEVTITVPWGYVCGRWYGNQMERPILALHGWQDSCGSFAKLAPIIAPHRSILCIDLPGHGHSSHLPAGILYHNLEFVRVILRIIKQYRWPKVSLLGHSMGGSICFHFASFYPDLVDMIISFDIIKTIYYNEQVLPMNLAGFVDKALIDNERLLQPSDSIPPPPTYSFEECEQLLYKGGLESVDLENCKYILERNIKKSKLYPNRYYFQRDQRIKCMQEFNSNMPLTLEMAKRICDKKLPYLVIKGGKSRTRSAVATPLDTFLEENNENFKSITYPNGTHHLHLNNAEDMAEYVIDFLQKYKQDSRILGKL